jgi:putative transposase
MRTGCPGHLKAFDYVGLYRYFLTFCTHQRQRHFAEAEPVEVVLRQILRAAEDERFGIVAYCFMPDHLHLLVEAGSESSDCLSFIKRAKQFSAFHYSKIFRHRLWQRYGYERTLREEDTTLAVAKYILENPVRAGLVTNPEDHPFSGSKTHTLSEVLEAIGDFRGPPKGGYYR